MRNIDPYEGSFHFPTDTIKLALYDFNGTRKWQKELPNVVPGIWFLPVMPFDLDGDGKDEIFLVNTHDPVKPFDYDGYVMQRLDPDNGKVTGEWPWSFPSHNQANSYKWRFFIAAGYVNQSPVLITSQGTYRDIHLQAWNPGMNLRWEKTYPDTYMGPVNKQKMTDHYRAINKDRFDGPRGSHTCPIIDTNNDGIDEILIGERCIDLNKGEELFIMDHNKWDNHSDIVQPVWNDQDNGWNFWTCREKGDDERRRSRAVFFNGRGDRIWAINQNRGHFHKEWVANIGPNGKKVAMAARYAINKDKAVNYQGQDYEYWTFDAFTGKAVSIPFNPLGRPFDFNGDGIHEILVGNEIKDNKNNTLGHIGNDAGIITLHKIKQDLPGEQIFAYYPDGTLKLWADKNAQDSETMQKAFNSKYYQRNIKLMGVGYNHYKFLMA